MYFNGVLVTRVIYNGIEINIINFNGTVVFNNYPDEV